MKRLLSRVHNYTVAKIKLAAVIALASLSLTGNADNGRAPILIAIVDDGFVTDLPLLEGLVWRNPGEIPNNGIDDDGNGRVDDISGWDVSDQDENTRPPATRVAEYPHGTYMAAQIAHVIREHLGEMDEYPIKLVFIKAISDTAPLLNLKDGYRGLNAALGYSPDVVNLSWSGGILSPADSKALATARASDTFIVGAVGTYPQREAAYPASHPAVFGVAGIDADNRLFRSNYGEEVAIAALSSGYPGSLLGADSPQDIDGNSNSAARVSATVALMKHASPRASNGDIRQCLQATASPLDTLNPHFAGLLGAGALDTRAAIACITTGKNYRNEPILNPKGSITFTGNRHATEKTQQWTLAPKGLFAGMRLNPYVEGDSKRSSLAIYPIDAVTGDVDRHNAVYSGLLRELPVQIETTATALQLVITADANTSFQFATAFATRNIDQSTMFCSGIEAISITQSSAPVFLEDGSQAAPYSINADCKWLLTPQQGFDLVMEFLHLDTELDVDSLYLFRGDSTTQTELLMRLSGSELPPRLVIKDDQALLWFTSDAKNQGQGFTVKLSLGPTSQP